MTQESSARETTLLNGIKEGILQGSVHGQRVGQRALGTQGQKYMNAACQKDDS